MSRASPAPRTAGTLGAEEWRLLIRLPAEVMIATVAARDDGPRRTIAEGLAGLDAIAAGRGSDSELVRSVVAAIYREPADGYPDDGSRAAATEDFRDVLGRCRRAATVLRGAAAPADAAAYCQWVRRIAARVCDASRSGGAPGDDDGQGGAVDEELLDELTAALSS
jgi:hypothetical protein